MYASDLAQVAFSLAAALFLLQPAASCPHGFRERPESGDCYFLSWDVHDFVHCQQNVCGPKNSTLAAITGESDNEFLAGLVPRQESAKGAFLGLYSTGADHAHDWGWPDGTRISFAGWMPTQPDNFCGHEKCVVMTSTGWNDIGCHVKNQCLCKLGVRTSSQFEAAQKRLAAENDNDYRDCGTSAVLSPVVASALTLSGLVLALCTDFLSNRKAVAEEPFAEHRDATPVDDAVLLQARHEERAEAPFANGSRVDTSMLSGVRAILMMTVATNHFLLFFHPSFGGLDFAGVLQGGGAVTGFFCLSGFVMAVAYAGRNFSGDKMRDRAERRNFYVKRFARLAPLYYFSLFLDPRVLFKYGLFAIPQALITLTATQSWVGEFAFGWNGPLWSVSTIAFFYLRFPFLMPRLWKWQRRGRAMRIVALLMSLKYLGGPSQYMKVRTDPVDALGMFFLGVLAGQKRSEVPALSGKERALWARYADWLTVALGCWLALSGVLAFRYGQQGQLTARVTVEAIIALPFSYWLEAITLAGRDACSVRLLNTAVLSHLGSWSYGVYCLQIPVWSWIITLKGSTWGPQAFRPFEVLPAMAALVFAARLATAWIEKPVQKWIQKKLCVSVPLDTPSEEIPGAQMQPRLTTVSVTVPPGALPGTQLQVAVPQSGQVVQVQVPSDAVPGTVLTVQAVLPDGSGAAASAGTCREHWSPESGRCLCMDPQADGDFSLPLYCALTCLCCIPKRECCCFNPCNPRAGCGNSFADWRTGNLGGSAAEDLPPRQDISLQDFNVGSDVQRG